MGDKEKVPEEKKEDGKKNGKDDDNDDLSEEDQALQVLHFARETHLLHLPPPRVLSLLQAQMELLVTRTVRGSPLLRPIIPASMSLVARPHGLVHSRIRRRHCVSLRSRPWSTRSAPPPPP